MTPNKIQYELKENGVTQKAIADKRGVTPYHVSAVIHKQRISDRVMRAVAEAIGKPVQSVFPEYYLAPPKRRTSKTARI
jgi:lambda repressor-like predicted transcriptional regulator